MSSDMFVCSAACLRLDLSLSTRASSFQRPASNGEDRGILFCRGKFLFICAGNVLTPLPNAFSLLRFERPSRSTLPLPSGASSSTSVALCGLTASDMVATVKFATPWSFGTFYGDRPRMTSQRDRRAGARTHISIST